jgi:hypothetical protein
LKVQVQVTVETKADARQAFINFQEVPLDANGKGSAPVEMGEGNVLQWGIVGTPGTSYKITLAPAQGKLQIDGKHPIELEIADGHTRAGGTRRFSVVAGGA